MKKMNWLPILAAGAVLCGCGSSEAKAVDTGKLADSLLNNITYDEELTEVKADEIENYIVLEDGVEAVMYMGSGSTAESVAVFTAGDEDTARKQKTNVENYLADQKSAFKDYMPDEAARIEDAVVEAEGRYVVMCVSGDSDQAEEIIDQAFDD